MEMDRAYIQEVNTNITNQANGTHKNNESVEGQRIAEYMGLDEYDQSKSLYKAFLFNGI